MKKITILIFMWVLLTFIPVQAIAGVSIHVSIPLPPPILFGLPPAVVVIPDTNSVYAVPDIDVDLYFWNGWWWRPWDGRWYRSRYYDRGWVFYNQIPVFYGDVYRGWRGYYNNHMWHGHRWNYEKISHHMLRSNWQRWQNDRHWEMKRKWNVHNYQQPNRSNKRTMVKPRHRQESPKIHNDRKHSSHTIRNRQPAKQRHIPQSQIKKSGFGKSSGISASKHPNHPRPVQKDHPGRHK